MSGRRPSSFRVRLALQTMLVAGIVVTGFGAGAWWFALEQQARNHDLRIGQEARRLWTQLTPRDREEQFARAVEKIFSESGEVVAVTVMWHTEGNPSATFSGPTWNEANRPVFAGYLPRGSQVVTSGVDTDSTTRPARAFSPGIGNSGSPRRPIMPEIRTPDFFTIEDGKVKWRFGAFSNPHYTVFVGLSRDALQAEARGTALWFAGGGVIALLIAGLGAWWASGRAIRPLDRIVSISERMSAGNLGERIPLHGGDDREFAQLIGALNDMTARLERSFEQSARFTADASHELKTPLAVIQGTLNDVLRTEALDDESHQRISVVLHQMSRLKHITQSLLLLSQADAGELPVRRESYNLSEDLEGLMEDAEALCEAAGLAFEKHIEPGVFVEADRALMHQVLQNLVSNAVKHNQADGRVEIRFVRHAKGARFEISNTCAAIPGEVQERLFERFYRAEDSRSGEGFGLGLNIARELARANGAKLELMPAGSGMIGFSVNFPHPMPTET
ncbi:HAMP domain-containing protein [Akkermansiaceae bacterium]|nr:HAMP domain-containing protein [Akkermansiaceae bacterium]